MGPKIGMAQVGRDCLPLQHLVTSVGSLGMGPTSTEHFAGLILIVLYGPLPGHSYCAPRLRAAGDH